MTRKELSGFAVSRASRDAGVYCRVLDVGVAEPVFDKREIGTGVEEIEGVLG
jgi:hypothetical protein